MLLVPYDDLVFGYALQMDGDGGRFAFILRAEQSAAGQQRKYGTVMSVLVLSENRIIVAYESGNLCEFTFPLSLLSLKGAFGNREGLSLFEWQFGCEEETNFPPTLSPIKSMDAMPKTPSK
jgi:hypothetical protein